MSELESIIVILCSALVHVLIIRYLNFSFVRRTIPVNILLYMAIFLFTFITYKLIPLPSIRFPVIVVLVALCAIVIFKLSFFEAFALTLVGNFILVVGDFFVLSLFVNILKYELAQLNSFFYTLCANLFILFIILLIIALRQIFRKKNTKLKISTPFFFIVCMIFIIVICVFNLLFNTKSISTNPSAVILFNLAAFAVYFIICLFLIFIYFTSNHQKLLLEQQTREYEQLVEYTEVIESLYEDIRNQKHDFSNVLLSIKGYLDNNQLAPLKEYYEEAIMNQYKESPTRPFILSLSMIQNSGLKGILAYKLNNAADMGIKVLVNIFSEIRIHGIDSIDICKVIGILVDNAIDASFESVQKEIHLGMEVAEQETSIVIANTFLIEPNLNQIYKRGFSTKGKNRGLGLYNVKETLSRYPSVLLVSTIENNTFYQELILPL